MRKTLRLESVQPGQIEAFEQTPLFVKLPAYVEKLYVDIGDRVEQDKPVADLWIPELHDEVRQKEAMVVHAKAGVQQATAAVLAAEKAVATAEAGLREAQAGTIRASGQYERWKSEHARIVELAASQSIDRRLVDETQNELSAAEAARGEAEAKVASAEAALAEAHGGRGKSQGRSGRRPGRRRQRRGRPGPHQFAPRLHARPHAVRGDRRPAQRRSRRFRPAGHPGHGQAAVHRGPQRRGADLRRRAGNGGRPDRSRAPTGSVHVQALPGRTIEGTVTRTSWALGANRTLRTELDIPNPQGVLRPGMYATAEIVLQQHVNVLALPLTAVVTVDEQALCCCVEDGKIVRRPITLGLRTAQDVEVEDGLKGEEIVVQTQAASLQEGQTVEVARPE